MSSVVVRDLHKTFGTGRLMTRVMVRGPRRVAVSALDGVSFSLERGSVVALTGANGSGKSTLLRVLATLLLPSAGVAEVDGHDVVADPIEARRSVCFVPADDRSFSLPLTGRENLAFFTALRGVPPRSIAGVVDAALEQVGLAAAANDAYATYSSGMRQRLALARALAADAKVLLLDEPFRALDAESSEHLRAVIAAGAQAGLTVLTATHQLAELDGLWTRVLHLDHGILVADTPAGVTR